MREKRCPKRWRPDRTYKERLSSIMESRPGSKSTIEEKIAFIEESLLKALDNDNDDRGFANSEKSCHDELSQESEYAKRIRVLIGERRALRHSHATCAQVRAERARLGKEIQKAVKRKHAAEKSERIGQILREFRDLKEITKLANNHQNKAIIEMKDKEGNIKQEKEDIAEVFVAFYGDLLKSRTTSAEYRLDMRDAAGPPPVHNE